jgi:hypothetical protein
MHAMMTSSTIVQSAAPWSRRRQERLLSHHRQSWSHQTWEYPDTHNHRALLDGEAPAYQQPTDHGIPT